jgi:hypothetical protein
MPPAPHSSDYIVAAVMAGLAAGIFAVFPAVGASSPAPLERVQSSATAPFSYVDAATGDRGRKGDRLAVGAAANTTVVLKNMVAPQFNGRGMIDVPARQRAIEIDDKHLLPALPEGCEAQASSLADPTLSRLVGRCLT